MGALFENLIKDIDNNQVGENSSTPASASAKP